jgi:hypothetical protein
MRIVFEYKCRRCGQTAGGRVLDAQDDKGLAETFLRAAIDQRGSPVIPALVIHACSERGSGVADLIGYCTK